MGLFDIFKSSSPAPKSNEKALEMVTKYFNNGAVYMGEWANNNPNGFGTYKFANGDKYEGEWLNGKRHGQGIQTFANGAVYAGIYVQDKREGFGVYTYPDGEKYIGNWKNGEENGEGKYLYSSGNVFEGTYVNGRWNGFGVYTFANGNRCECNWVDGQKNGMGKDIFTSGEYYDGMFVNGKRCGHGVYRYENGDFYEGSWDKGVRHGSGKYTYANGNYEMGSWFEGEKNGQFIKTYTNGKVERQEFKNGQLISTTVLTPEAPPAPNAPTPKPDDMGAADISEADLLYTRANRLFDEGSFEESMSLLHRAADLGHAEAMNNIGWSYLYGEGVEEDLEKAVFWLKKAYENGSSKAAGNIGTACVYMGYEGISKKELFNILSNGADKGCVLAYAPLGECYYNGDGCDENSKLAVYWFYKASLEGVGYGSLMLGHLFLDGYYLPKVPSMAKYCYLKAADDGFTVDEMLEKEIISDVDPVEPILIFNDEEDGFFDDECPQALYNEAVSLLYPDGERTESQNAIRRAHTYLRQASAQGHSYAMWLLAEDYLDNYSNEDTCESCIISGTRVPCHSEAGSLLISSSDRGNLRGLCALLDRYEDNEIVISDEVAENFERMRDKLFQGYDPYDYEDEE